MNIKFTKKAYDTVGRSGRFAAKLGSNVTGTEHLLLALADDNTSVAGALLNRHGLSVKKIIEVMKRHMDVNFVEEDNGITPPFTPRCEHIIKRSAEEAARFGKSVVGTEHLLMSLLSEPECIAIEIMAESGIDAEKFFMGLNQSIGGEAFSATDADNVDDGGLLDDEPGMMGEGREKQGSMLEKYGRDLTLVAQKGGFDPVIGRDKEIYRIMQVLSRRTKNNPCLIGEPGVGKTAVVEGLAMLIVSGAVPETMKGKKIVSLDLSAMVAGAKYRGEFEERLKQTMDEVMKKDNIILFIDEIHTIIGAGSAEGTMDAANIMKPALSRGQLQVIGATTINEYRKHIEKDAALERRFQPIMIDEPDDEATLAILTGLREKYEKHHGVKITDEALKAAVTLSQRYINDRYLPDKAIDLIDEAASRQRMKKLTPPSEITELEDKLKILAVKKADSIKQQDFEKAAAIRDEEKAAREALSAKRAEWNKTETDNSVYQNDIAEVVASWTGIPVKRIGTDEGERLMKLEEELHKRVIGQEEAVSAVARAVRRGRTGLKDPKRPIGSFIFLGPTGVGKTELSKALAEALFGDEKALVRVDMSEYMEKHSVSRLVGSPPGYVGYDEGGQLTEKIRRKPYAVVLFDEIEKAHPDVFNILLQILEDGRLTDSQGRLVDFKNTVIIMTSNVGARNITEPRHLGFSSHSDAKAEHEDMRSAVTEELKKSFRPEFLNRIDDIIVFKALDKDEISQIAEILLKDLIKRATANEINITVAPGVASFIAQKGFDPVFGARPLKRAIQTMIEDKIAEVMLSGKYNGNINVDVSDDEIIFNCDAQAANDNSCSGSEVKEVKAPEEVGGVSETDEGDGENEISFND